MNRGISLLALIITIVVLIIMTSAITITMINTQMIDKTQTAIRDKNAQEAYDNIIKEVISIQTKNKYLAVGDNFADLLQNKLIDKYPSKEYKVEYIPEVSSIIVTYKVNNKEQKFILDKEYTLDDFDEENNILNSIHVEGNPKNWTKEEVVLNVKPTVSSNILTEYSFDNGVTWQSESTKVYTENTLGIKVLAKNKEGKIIGPVTVDINKIDKVAPSFNIEKDIEYNQDGTTKEVETLIITLGENVNILKNINVWDTQSGTSLDKVKCYKDGVEIINTSIFNQVGRYNVIYEAIDQVGNISQINREILVRWPVGGKYILAVQNTIGIGLGNETTGMGLYEDDETTGKDISLPYASKYYYSGKTVDNYVSFPNTSSDKSSPTTWRIINIAENDTIKIVTDNLLEDKYSISDSAWTNRWKWNKSAIYSSINSWVNSGNVGDSNEYNIDFSENGHIAQGIFYVGTVDRRGTTESNSSTLQEVIDERTNTKAYLGDDTYTESEAKALLPWSSKLGIIMVTDVTKSSNSANVFSIRSMQNNRSDFEDTSWMYKGKNEWSINASNDTNQFWSLESDQFLAYYTTNTALYQRYIRLTTYLKNNTILSGSGQSSDPFVVQENWSWFDPFATVNN